MTKSLVFLFDGTSNEIDLDFPTNVLKLASGVANRRRDGGAQMIFYKKGVGTKESDRSGALDITDKARALFEEKVGMISGEGVYNNILQAYEDLCFNYEPGDDIYVFGFSRGAYTARSFCGFVHSNAIAKRVHIENVLKADKRYREQSGEGFRNETVEERTSRLLEETNGACCSPEDQQRLSEMSGLPIERHPLIRIRFLGLWDTVKTITAGRDDALHEFHIDHLEPTVERSRHAVALDEYRKEFNVTPLQNIRERNRAAFYGPPEGEPDRPKDMNESDYHAWEHRAHQEVWFAGNHGSVGGGGDVRGLSDEALLWVLEGARDSGLRIDLDQESKIFELRPNHFESLDNTVEDGALERLWDFKGRHIDKHVRCGPNGYHEIAPSVIRRVAASKLDPFDSGRVYSPDAIEQKHPELWADVISEAQSYTKVDWEMSLMAKPYSLEGNMRTFDETEVYTHKVESGQSLGVLARDVLGPGFSSADIIAVNKLDITHPDRIQRGQLINLPVTDGLRAALKS